MERENGRKQSGKRPWRGADSSPFNRQAHALVDELPDDSTWQQLAERVRQEIELEAAVLECERQFAFPRPRRE